LRSTKRSRIKKATDQKPKSLSPKHAVNELMEKTINLNCKAGTIELKDENNKPIFLCLDLLPYFKEKFQRKNPTINLCLFKVGPGLPITGYIWESMGPKRS